MDTADTRTRILDAAQGLVQRLGANAISYQHVSAAVGIRKASIHHHFPTKDDLIEALVRRHSAYFLGVVDKLFATDLPAPEKLRRYCGLFEATLARGTATGPARSPCSGPSWPPWAVPPPTSSATSTSRTRGGWPGCWRRAGPTGH